MLSDSYFTARNRSIKFSSKLPPMLPDPTRDISLKVPGVTTFTACLPWSQRRNQKFGCGYKVFSQHGRLQKINCRVAGMTRVTPVVGYKSIHLPPVRICR